MTPLAGIRVLEFGGFIAGPGAGMRLRDLGADVIKVEPPGGDAARGMGAYGRSILHNFNRGKRSLAIDVQHELGQQIIGELLDRTDVVIQNLSPGAMARLGLDATSLCGQFPRLIYLTVAGYRAAGPNGGRRGFDGAVQAEAAMMYLNGERGTPPMKVGFPIVDVATAHIGAEAVLAALITRMRTGRGGQLEVPMFDVAVHLQNVPLSTFIESGEEPPRTGNGLPHNAPAADLVPTRDGYIVLSAYLEDHWRRLCETLGRTDLLADWRFATNDRRVAERPALLRELGAAFGPLTTAEAIELLSSNGLVVGIARTYQDLAACDEFVAGEFVMSKDCDGKPVYPIVRPPYVIGSEPATYPSPPALGADNEEILRELGWGDRMGSLQQAGVLP